MNSSSGYAPADDIALAEVESTLLSLDPSGKRWASVIRKTYDMIYLGAETGRFRWAELLKTEKTHFGSLIEINAQREFKFNEDGKLDFLIAGHEVDAKWSQKSGGWMLPPEIFDKIALVVTADDQKAQFSVGLVRTVESFRLGSKNRDGKSNLNAVGRQNIRWLWSDEPFPQCALLRLTDAQIDGISGSGSAASRLAELFRVCESQLVDRTDVETVARQLDTQKRLRHNGGARSLVQAEGFIILSGAYHADLAEGLGLERPSARQYISARVTPTFDESSPMIDDARWRLIAPDETPTAPAPLVKKWSLGGSDVSTTTSRLRE